MDVEVPAGRDGGGLILSNCEGTWEWAGGVVERDEGLEG